MTAPPADLTDLRAPWPPADEVLFTDEELAEGYYIPPRWESPPIYDRTLGSAIIELGEEFPVLKGPQAGQAFRWANWQRYLCECVFEVRDDYRLRYREGIVGVARQNGKSLVGSRLAANGLLRGPMGSEIYSVAGDRQQARIVFEETKRLIQSHPALENYVTIYRDVLEVPEKGNIYRVLSADAKLQQGLSPFLVLFDEVHVQPNEDLWDAMAGGMGARPDALLLGITTAGFNPESLLGRKYEYGMKVAAGEIDDPTFGFWWWEPAAGLDGPIWDTRSWVQANPSLAEGITLWEDMVSQANKQTEPSFRRFRLNQWVPLAGETWMDMQKWDQQARKDWEPPEGGRVFMGFDGSVSRDATGFVAVDAESGTAWVPGVWEPRRGDMEWKVPRGDVDTVLDGMMEKYDVTMGYDPAWWRSEGQEWEKRYGKKRIVEWPVSNARMAPACGQVYAKIAEGNLWHDGDATLRRHVLNSIVKPLGPKGDSIQKISRDSTQWIDLAVCLVIAVDMWERYGDVRKARLVTF